MTVELVEFLTARYDEDERDATARRGIFPSPSVQDDGYVWLHIRPGGNAVITRYPRPVEGYDDMAKLRNWADTEHGWTQARILAEVDAKRRIVDLHGPADHEFSDVEVCSTCDRGGPLPYPCPTLRLLALPYADHPDYDEAWRP